MGVFLRFLPMCCDFVVGEFFFVAISICDALEFIDWIIFSYFAFVDFAVVEFFLDDCTYFVCSCPCCSSLSFVPGLL